MIEYVHMGEPKEAPPTNKATHLNPHPPATGDPEFDSHAALNAADQALREAALDAEVVEQDPKHNGTEEN